MSEFTPLKPDTLQPDTSLFHKVYQSAMRMLAAREHSQKELTDKLAHRFDDLSVIEQVIESLQASDYQSDSRFCESFVRTRMAKGFGQRKIRLELSRRGIDEALSQQVLAEFSDDWLEGFQHLFNKKYGLNDLQDVQQFSRISRYFQSRGYSFDQIRMFQRAFGADF